MRRIFLSCVSIFLFTVAFSSIGFCQWVQVSNPLGVYCLVANGTDLFAGSFDTSGVWISADNGASWQACGDSGFGGVYSLAFMDSCWFAGTYEKGVWCSKNAGKNWSPANTGIAGEDIYGLVSVGSHLIGIGLGGIFQSNDRGTTWKRTSNKYSLESSASPLAVGDGNVYAATSGGLLRSGDSGASWVSLSDSMYWAVAADGANIYASNDSGFFFSANSGMSWTMVSSEKFGLIHVSGNAILAGPQRGNDMTCYLSTNFGTSWINLEENHRSTSLVISGPNIVKGSNNTGIWYRPVSGVLAGVHDHNRPDIQISFSPNPTTGFVTFHNVPSDIQNVFITNQLGITVLERAHPNATEFTLDLSKLPSGTYYARFSLPIGIVTRKIMKE